MTYIHIQIFVNRNNDRQRERQKMRKRNSSEEQTKTEREREIKSVLMRCSAGKQRALHSYDLPQKQTVTNTSVIAQKEIQIKEFDEKRLLGYHQ